MKSLLQLRKSKPKEIARLRYKDDGLQRLCNSGLDLPACKASDRFMHLISLVRYKDYTWEITIADLDGHGTLMARFNADGREWSTRKWHLSPFMTDSEIIQTTLKLVLTSEEREAREKFLYRGRPVFGPHIDVNELHSLVSDPDHLDTRKEPS